MTRALEGIEVLDFGANLAGPFAPQMMSDLGAEVIKIEEPWSDARTMGRGSSFFGCQRGKRSLAVDLKTPEGTEIVHQLIARADIIHHNLRPGVAERLKYDYETAKRLNPSIIYCHTTGWGSTGPNATWPGWDQFGQALGGAEYHGGACEHGNPPMWYRYGQCDAVNAMHSLLGVLQALYHRDRTGEGQMVETCIVNGGMTINSDLYLRADGPAERAVLDVDQRGLGDWYRLYETADGWITVACVTEAERTASGPPSRVPARWRRPSGPRPPRSGSLAWTAPAFPPRSHALPMPRTSSTIPRRSSKAGWCRMSTPKLAGFIRLAPCSICRRHQAESPDHRPHSDSTRWRCYGELGYSGTDAQALKDKRVVNFPD